MKHRTLICILVIFTSCDNLVRFESPQPTGQRDEKTISNKLVGQYRSLNDSTFLTITSSEIVRTVDWKTVLHISKVDSLAFVGVLLQQKHPIPALHLALQYTYILRCFQKYTSGNFIRSFNSTFTCAYRTIWVIILKNIMFNLSWLFV